MNAAPTLSQGPQLMQYPDPPSEPARIMRRAASIHLDWTPALLPLFSAAVDTDLSDPEEETIVREQMVRAGNLYAVVRPGFERWPFGCVSDRYKPLCHVEAAKTVATCGAPVQATDAWIDGHGYHTVHHFALTHLRAGEINGLKVSDELALVHDHTGTGSVRASIVTRVGGAVVGSATFLRRIHTSEGELHVGAGIAAWTDAIASLCETAILRQDSILEILTLASKTLVNEGAVEAFRAHTITAEIGQTLLHVALAHHEAKKGNLRWGVWSRRLEGDALRVIADLLGLKIRNGR